jgi:Na+/melibiose symporter-like transporter
MKYVAERTYDTETAPKSSWLTICITGAFKDTIFQFISLFMMLFIQYGTNLPLDPNYGTYFLVITIGLIIIKVFGLIIATPLACHLTNIIKFKKFGTFRPWIFIGSVTSMIFFLLIFFNTLDGWWFVGTFLFYYFLFEFFFCLNDISYWGYFTTLSYDEKVKAKFGGFSSLFISLGTYTLIAITPSVTGGQAAFALKLIAIIIAVLFIISSFVNMMVIKERKSLKENYSSHYTDCFKIMKNNKYIIPGNIILILFFAGIFLLMGNSVNLFYYTYGYGNEAIYGSFLASGGFNGVSFIFSIVYGVASTLSQFLYPYINRKYTRKQILSFSVFGATIMFGLIYAFFSQRAMVYFFFIAEFILVFFIGQINAVSIMINNLVIEYNDYISGERRDREIMTIRAALSRSAGAIQSGLFYLFLIFSGLLDLNSQIGSIEAEGIINPSIDVVGSVNNAITSIISSSDYDPHLMIFKALIYIVPMVLFWILLFVYLKYYDLDEIKFREVVSAINQRNNQQQ